MAGHKKATEVSQALCEALFSEVQVLLPSAARSEAIQTCALYEPGSNRFAHIYHRSRNEAVRIYFRAISGDVPIVAAELTVHTRPKVEKGWDKEFPCFVEIQSASQARAAAQFLVAHAYPLSIKKRASRRQLNSPTRLAEEVLSSEVDMMEGAVTTILVNRYERNPATRKRCIAHHGLKCLICGLDFLETYGEIGRDFIHVHHLVPLSSGKEKHKIDPVTDLIPICPNCHAIVHRRSPPYSPAEVKASLMK